MEEKFVYEETEFEVTPIKDVKDSKPIEKKDLYNYPNDKGFLLYNIFSPSECEYYIDQAKKLGLTPASVSKELRNCDKVTFRSEELASLVFEKVKQYVTDIEIPEENETGNKFLAGLWKPIGLNETWRLCRYEPGGHFGPHCDGGFVRSGNERSLKTFMLYLNMEYEGGTTNFINNSQPLSKDPVTGKFRADPKHILYKLKADTGMAIIFNHNILHEGDEVHKGEKYILRSEIMFERKNMKKLPEEQEQAIKCYELAQKLESDGKAMEAMQYYRKAFKLYPPLEDAVSS